MRKNHQMFWDPMIGIGNKFHSCKPAAKNAYTTQYFCSFMILWGIALVAGHETLKKVFLCEVYLVQVQNSSWEIDHLLQLMRLYATHSWR